MPSSLFAGATVPQLACGNPIIPLIPISSFCCAICNPAIAACYAIGAPSVWTISARRLRPTRGADAAYL
jgi:hypothetical protein